MQQHYSFPSIEQFSNMRRSVAYRSQFVGMDADNKPILDLTRPLPKLEFEGTTKLHGTNAGVTIDPDWTFYCQSRERIITPQSDNNGFAAFVHGWKEEQWSELRRFLPSGKRTVVYGEWAGGSIQGKVALNKLPKSFYIFAARTVVDSENPEDDKDLMQWLDIRDWTFSEEKCPNVFNIYSFPTFRITIDMENPAYALEEINKWVSEVEAECPVSKQLGVSGIGEGIVFKPTDPAWKSSRYWMKCKGQEHAGSKTKKMITVDVERFETEQAFVADVLDEPRLQQAFTHLKQTHGFVEMKHMGEFIKWLHTDVLKEKYLEMEENSIPEKNLGKLLATPARKWFAARLQEQ